MIFNGCHADLDTKISDLKKTVEALESRVTGLNESLTALQASVSALESNDHITEIVPIVANGDTTGFKIIFTSGTTISLPNGTDGLTPFIGIQQDNTTGYYYWTLRMGDNGTTTWMTNNYGLRIRATGIVPQMKIESGYWWVSYDGGSGWTKLFEANGKEGTSVFKSIDCSDPYFVVLVLVNGTQIKIPTMKGVEELSAMCDTINSNVRAYSSILNGIDTSMFIIHLSEIVEKNVVVGYNFTLSNGEVLSIHNGDDGRDPIYLSIAGDIVESRYYWTYSTSKSGIYSWLMNNGERVPADPVNGTPRFGAKDTLGVYYFTITYGGKTSWLLDQNRNKVQATGRYGFRFFSGSNVTATSVELTLADGSKVTLPRGRKGSPSVVFSVRNYSGALMNIESGDTYYSPMLKTDSLYHITATFIDTVFAQPTNYSASEAVSALDLKLEAIGLNNAYVRSINLKTDEFSSANIEPSGAGFIKSYSIPYEIVFSVTGRADTYSSVALFFSWNDKNLMKVLYFAVEPDV